MGGEVVATAVHGFTCQHTQSALKMYFTPDTADSPMVRLLHRDNFKPVVIAYEAKNVAGELELLLEQKIDGVYTNSTLVTALDLSAAQGTAHIYSIQGDTLQVGGTYRLVLRKQDGSVEACLSFIVVD